MTSVPPSRLADPQDRLSPERPAPFDRRLVALTSSVRVLLGVLVALGLLTAATVLAEAVILARIVARTFLADATIDELVPLLIGLACLVTLRALLVWTREVVAYRAATSLKSSLRVQYLRALLDQGPIRLGELRTGEVATTVLPGLDSLDRYFARYLPQIVLGAAVPVLIVAWVFPHDWVSGVILVLTVPLIPVFMILIGSVAERRTAVKWRKLQSLGGRFLDAVQGLPTLRIFGRAHDHVTEIRRVTDDYRRETTEVLRIAFLSALVLELVATLSTALIAVGIGLRVVNDTMAFEPALAILILAPEAYLPLRRVAIEFHAAMEGVQAAGKVLDVIEDQIDSEGGRRIDLTGATISLDLIGYTYPDHTRALEEVSIRFEPGVRVAVVGPSGSGKSTIVNLLLRFAEPTEGRIHIDGRAAAESDLSHWRSQISWLGQDPHIFRGTISDNIRLANPTASPAELRRAAELAGALEFIESLPDGFETYVEEQGISLSAGQRRRIGLARALLREAPLLIVDEPLANIDPENRVVIKEALSTAARDRTLITVAHDMALARDADWVVVMEQGKLVEQGPPLQVLGTVADA